MKDMEKAGPPIRGFQGRGLQVINLVGNAVNVTICVSPLTLSEISVQRLSGHRTLWVNSVERYKLLASDKIMAILDHNCTYCIYWEPPNMFAFSSPIVNPFGGKSHSVLGFCCKWSQKNTGNPTALDPSWDPYSINRFSLHRNATL